MPESTTLKHSEKTTPIEPPGTLTLVAGILLLSVAISLIRRATLLGDSRIALWLVVVPDVLGIWALIYLSKAVLRIRSGKRQVFSESLIARKQFDVKVAIGLFLTTILIGYFQIAKTPAWLLTYAPYNLPIILLIVFGAAICVGEMRRDESLDRSMSQAKIICRPSACCGTAKIMRLSGRNAETR